MANISQIKVGSTTYDIKDNRLNNGTATKLAYYNTANSVSAAENLSFQTGNSTATSPAVRNMLHINGTTYGNTANQLISGTAGLLSFGDGGPQITFDTTATPGGGQAGALIFTDHDSAAAGASFHFLSNQNDWNVISKRFHARTSISIGQNLPNTSYNLYVNGSTNMTGNTLVGGTLKIGGHVTEQYNSTTQALDFIFS